MLYSPPAQPLDAGAHGLMIPRICTAEQVLNVVQLMKYPPIGIRGNAQNRGYTRFIRDYYNYKLKIDIV